MLCRCCMGPPDGKAAAMALMYIGVHSTHVHTHVIHAYWTVLSRALARRVHACTPRLTYTTARHPCRESPSCIDGRRRPDKILARRRADPARRVRPYSAAPHRTRGLRHGPATRTRSSACVLSCDAYFAARAQQTPCVCRGLLHLLFGTPRILFATAAYISWLRRRTCCASCTAAARRWLTCMPERASVISVSSTVVNCTPPAVILCRTPYSSPPHTP